MAVKRQTSWLVIAALSTVATAAGACSGGDVVTDPTPAVSFPVLGEQGEPLPSLPELDPDRVAVGRQLHLDQCAACHGVEGEGDPEWMTPNADGSYPPPPQDAGGHTWHHADQLLVSIVLEGSDFPQSRMPAFGETLSEDEVMSILEYYKSLWGPQERDVQWNATWRAQQQP